MRLSYGILSRSERKDLEVRGTTVRIGREPGNDLVLEHPSVPPQAAILIAKEGKWELFVIGSSPVEVNDRKVPKGTSIPVASGSVLKLWPFSITVEIPEAAVASTHVARRGLDLELNALTLAVHLELLKRMDLAARGTAQREDSDEYHTTLERNVDELADQKGVSDPARTTLTDHAAALCLRSQCVEGLLTQAGGKNVWEEGAKKRHQLLTAVRDLEQELTATVTLLGRLLKLDEAPDVTAKLARVDTDFWPAWERLGRELHPDFKLYLARRYLKKEIKDIVLGYGPLEDLLRLPSVTEIMVVDKDRIFIEKAGVLQNSGRRFISDDVTESIIQRIVARVGRRIDKSSPLVDARLADGSRVNAVIPPVAVSGPCLTVRKFPARKLTVADLVERNSLSKPAAEFLKAAVLARKNVLVSGGTGTGKTTLLNCLSDFISDKERIVTIEDTAELQLQKQHVVRMETKAANVEGAGALSIRDLVRNALRMRPDRIVVGECRGPEALDMLQAMNSGHDGSMTTLHANTAADVVLRLEVLVQMAAELPVASIHRQIASAIDVVVQLQRLRNGRRVVSQITQFVDVDPERGGVRTRDLFLLDGDGPDASLAPTGSLPTFMGDLIAGGTLNLETFYT